MNLESKVEKFLKQEVEKLGGICVKWVSPTMRGVPDRIVIVEGSVWFVEVKRQGGVTSKVQIVAHRLLVKVGAQVRIVEGKDGVEKFIGEVKNTKKH